MIDCDPIMFRAEFGFTNESVMKNPAVQKFRQKIAAGEPLLGLWITLESASITEMGVSLGLDWVVIDVEHGHLDYREILDHVRATVRSDTVILVRVLSCDQGIIKRVLDRKPVRRLLCPRCRGG